MKTRNAHAPAAALVALEFVPANFQLKQ